MYIKMHLNKKLSVKEYISNLDDLVIFTFIGCFLFDKFLPLNIYTIYGLLFIAYFFLKTILNRRLAISSGVYWQIFFMASVIVSMIYSKEIMSEIIYTTATTSIILLSFSQYFTNSNIKKNAINKVMVYFVFWSAIFVLFILITQWGSFQSGGRLGSRALGSEFGGATGFSYYSTLVMVILIWNTYYSKKHKLLNWGLVSGALLVNIMTGGRKAVILPLIFLVIFYFLLYRKRFSKLLYYSILSLVFIFVIFRLSLTIPVLYDVFGHRLEASLGFFSNESNLDTSTVYSDQYRMKLIEKGIELFSSSPIIGYGIGTSRILYSNVGLGYMHAHNNYIETLLSGGGIMFVIWYWIYLYLLKKIWIIMKQENSGNAQFFISFLIMNLLSDFGATMYNVLHYNLFVVFAAVYVRSVYIRNNKVENKSYIQSS